MKLIICEKCGEKYSDKMNCPSCPRPPVNAPKNIDDLVKRVSPVRLEYLWSSIYWESGTDELRQKLQEKRDAFYGLESWPAHIERA